jgi:glycerol uptake facilitator-like aquaporin
VGEAALPALRRQPAVARHYTQRRGWWRGRQWGRMLLSEGLATLVFAFTVQTLEAVGAPAGAAALAGGFLLAVLLEGFVGESGAHIHSIVTFALFLVGQADLAMLILYILAVHPAANLLATLLVWAVLPASTGLGVPLIGVGISVGRAFAFELIGSAFFVLVYYVLAFVRPYAQPPGLLGYECGGCAPGLTFSGAQHYGALAQFARCCPALLIGLLYGALSLAGRFISGAAFSLWRFLWPYALSHHAVAGVRGVDFWVYLVGPPLGALAAWGLLWLHRILFRRRARELHFRYLDYLEGQGEGGALQPGEAEPPTQPVDYLQTLPHGVGTLADQPSPDMLA